MVLKLATGHASNQFYVLFDDEFSTVPFMREGKINQNWIYLVKHSSQSGAPENICIKIIGSLQILKRILSKLQDTK